MQSYTFFLIQQTFHQKKNKGKCHFYQKRDKNITKYQIIILLGNKMI